MLLNKYKFNPDSKMVRLSSKDILCILENSPLENYLNNLFLLLNILRTA